VWNIFSQPRLIKCRKSQCPSIHTYVHCPSTKSFSDFYEIWYLGRDSWVLLGSRLYDPIQGQGHGGLKVARMAYFTVYLLCWYSCNLTTNGGLWYSKTISKSFLDRFLKLVLIRHHVTFAVTGVMSIPPAVLYWIFIDRCNWSTVQGWFASAV